MIQGANRDYFSNFRVDFQAANKFATASLRLIQPNIGVDGFNGPRREIKMRYEFDFELL